MFVTGFFPLNYKIYRILGTYDKKAVVFQGKISLKGKY